jgi:hypothetical protein
VAIELRQIFTAKHNCVPDGEIFDGFVNIELVLDLSEQRQVYQGCSFLGTGELLKRQRWQARVKVREHRVEFFLVRVEDLVYQIALVR